MGDLRGGRSSGDQRDDVADTLADDAAAVGCAGRLLAELVAEGNGGRTLTRELADAIVNTLDRLAGVGRRCKLCGTPEVVDAVGFTNLAPFSGYCVACLTRAAREVCAP